MLRAAICDCDLEEANFLKRKMESILKNDAIVSIYENLIDLYSYVVDERKGKVDVLCINIDQEGKGGLHTVTKIVSKYPPIKLVFMTQTFEMVKDISHLSPLYLLVKPYETYYIKDAIEMVVKELEKNKKENLVLKAKFSRNGILSIHTNDIYYIMSDKRILEIYELKQKHQVNMKLDELEEKLPDHFIRCHQSYIVNMDKIKKVEKEKIILSTNVIIPISKSRAARVKQAYFSYYQLEEC